MLAPIETPEEKEEPSSFIKVKVVKQERPVIENISPIVIQAFR